MHKITKGLKKKKKGKKSKHKEDELFKPEELEAYRKEHQQQQEQEQQVQQQSANKEGAKPGENEEWKKFNALTAGIDNILKKTQGDLDRIKSTSFFQRIPPASETKKEQEREAKVDKQKEELQSESASVLEAAVVPISESESEEEDEDDIFDTSYIDAIAAGEVKLAYIPESPTEQQQGDDPFDTSIAERAILGPAVEKKGKKLVPLGAAVEVLTGRVQAPTCLIQPKRPSTRRQILKEKDLLLGSFDDNANSLAQLSKDANPPPKTLLDDDAPLPLCDEPIDLSKTLHQISTSVTPKEDKPTRDIVAEFDIIAKKTPEDEEDIEFELLAAESLAKPITSTQIIPLAPSTQFCGTNSLQDSWNAFSDDKNDNKSLIDKDEVNFEDDPFDTTFAENILPGKVELKLIENEILNSVDDDFDFNPRAEEKLAELLKNKVSIHVTDPSGARESVSSLDRISESELNIIQPNHRDLLGGSITDLSKLDDQPLKPNEIIDDNYIEYSDPFDTSTIDLAAAPGQAELKFLEKELLNDIKLDDSVNLQEEFEEDFNPRAEERDVKPLNYNNIAQRKVSFELPLGTLGGDLLTSCSEDSSRISKPLTPYYIRNNSIPEQIPEPDDEQENEDPFDTSFVRDLAPGKVELKIIETELLESNLTHSLSDQNFDPRDERQVVIAKVIQEISKPPQKELPQQQESEPIDLLSLDNAVNTKVLTPAASVEDIATYIDPFDTSIASNILPGKTELKLLETELIHSTTSTLKPSLSDPDFNPRGIISSVEPQKKEQVNLLESSSDAVNVRPLTPLIDNKASSELDESVIDPFDTSIANNIAPGKAELKLLETELI